MRRVFYPFAVRSFLCAAVVLLFACTVVSHEEDTSKNVPAALSSVELSLADGAVLSAQGGTVPLHAALSFAGFSKHALKNAVQAQTVRWQFSSAHASDSALLAFVTTGDVSYKDNVITFDAVAAVNGNETLQAQNLVIVLHAFYQSFFVQDSVSIRIAAP